MTDRRPEQDSAQACSVAIEIPAALTIRPKAAPKAHLVKAFFIVWLSSFSRARRPGDDSRIPVARVDSEHTSTINCFASMHEPVGVRETSGLSKAQPHSVHPRDPDPSRRRSPPRPTQTPPSHGAGSLSLLQARPKRIGTPPLRTAQRLSPGVFPPVPMRDGQELRRDARWRASPTLGGFRGLSCQRLRNSRQGGRR